MTPTELAAEIFASFGTQTQTIIDQLAAYDYAGATGNAYALLANINAGAATMRNAASAPPVEIPEPPPDETDVPSIDLPEEPGLVDHPVAAAAVLGKILTPATDTGDDEPVFESETTFEGELDDDNPPPSTKSKKK